VFAIIDRNKNALHRGDAGLGVWNATTLCVPRRHFGEDFCTRKTFAPGLEEPPMFKMPAYDPVGIAILGFGVLAVVALGFAFY
jgi:hypothetical protein